MGIWPEEVEDMSVIPALSGLVLAAFLGVAHILAARRGQIRRARWLKPLPILLAAGVVSLAGDPSRGAGWIELGLYCSALGDVLLALPRERFLGGLASFLLAHIAYLRAFLLRGTPRGNLLVLLPVLGFAAVVLRRILPGARDMRGPVLAYVTAIAAMVWVAGEIWFRAPDASSRLALLGACSFMVSDSFLALDRFHRPLPYRVELVMSSYYAAQLAIAASCLV